jgi:desulfoferrodoxin
MAERYQVYKCEVCGNIVEVLHGGGGELVCCGQPMELLTENTVDAAKEKHVPVIEKVEGGYKVKVGEVPIPWKKNITSNGSSLLRMAPPTANTCSRVKFRKQSSWLPPHP